MASHYIHPPSIGFAEQCIGDLHRVHHEVSTRAFKVLEYEPQDWMASADEGNR